MPSIPLWIYILYGVVALIVAIAVVLFRYPKVDKTYTRSLRRLFWMALPGKWGRRARSTYARKQIRGWAKRNKRDSRTQFRLACTNKSYQEIMRRRQYDEYQRVFYPPSLDILGEAIMFGVGWFPILIYLIIVWQIPYLLSEGYKHMCSFIR